MPRGTGIAIRAVRLAFTGLAVAAVADAALGASGSVVNSFSYFTIESNLLAIVVLLAGGIRDPRGRTWAYLRGAVTLFMLITGIVSAVLLASVDVSLTDPWVDAVLHQVIPLAVLADWVLLPPWPDAGARPVLGWLVFPAAFCAYSLLRGPHAGWYPYPFLDPRHEGGYGRVASYVAALAVSIAALALAVNAIGRLRLKMTTRTARAPWSSPR